MRWWLYSTAFLATISHHTIIVTAAPDLAFPLNSQVPPVAFASQAYSFTFSSSTFTSGKPDILYSLDKAPAWLLLDSNGRTLRGTPTTADVGAATFGLNAQDEDGQTPSSVTLVVLQKPNIRAGQSILSSLQDAGPVSAPATLLLKPLENFQIRLSPSIFSGTSSSTTYYAVSSDSSPLPPWIQFDSAEFIFAGSSPPLVSIAATQQTYGIHLVASDVRGFGEAFVTFQIAISYHILAFATTVESLAIQAGRTFASRSLRDSLTLDGTPIDDSSIASVNADLPAWASLDSQTITIKGKPPTDFQSQVISIHVKDVFDDIASITFDLENEDSPNGDKSQSIDLTAIAGQYFSHVLDSISLRSTDNVSADLGNASDWLSFSSQNFTLQGFVPNALANETFDISITSENDTGKSTAQINLQIGAAKPRQPTISTILTHSALATPKHPTTTPSEMSQPDTATQTTTRSKILIVLCTVLPSLAILALIAICLCYRRRRSKRNGVEAQKELSARASFQTEGVPDTSDLPPVREESRISNDQPRQITPVQIPQLELFWAPDSLQKAKDRLSKRLRRKNMSIDSSWGEVLAPQTPQEPEQPVQNTPELSIYQSDVLFGPPAIPSYSAKRQMLRAKRLSKQRTIKSERASKALSTISNHAVGLQNRVSGMGHGSGVLVPETKTGIGNRSSWQTTLASMPQGDTRPSITTFEAFPRHPADNKENQGLGIVAGATKPSMRLVEHSSEPSESFEIQRQIWHRDRARNRLEVAARFSNAGSSRTPSLSLSRIQNARPTPNRTMSPSIPEDATIDSRMPSWSKWSGVGPAGRAESGIDVSQPAPLFARQQQPSRPPRDVSMASSGQFDSALSSDSQWEDENLVAELNDNGERHWLSDADSAAQSPRLPFDAFSSSQEEVGQANQVGVSRGARLIDKRKHISVEEENLRRSEKSQAGSFRFI